MADNMLIDGLIKFCDEKSKNIKLKAEPQVFIEIKQALEELKALKKEVELYINLDKTNFSDGYAKAIDEFLRKICEKYTEEERKGNYKQYCCNIKQELADIAEQLKAGGIDE